MDVVFLMTLVQLLSTSTNRVFSLTVISLISLFIWFISFVRSKPALRIKSALLY